MHHVLLRLEDVTISYGRRPAVHHVSASFPCGQLVCVLGANGAGKSSLLKAMLGWLPYEGRILVDGDDVARHRHRIAYVPQRDGLDPDFPLTAGEVVAQGRFQRLGLWRGFAAADHAAVAEAMDEMGVAALARRPIGTLSGGQLQRVLLARALATGADIFLLDEPLNGLDIAARDELLRQLSRWTTHHERLVLTVMHDLGCIAPWFTHALLLRTHLIAAGTVAEAVTPATLQATYGVDVPLPPSLPLRLSRDLFAGALARSRED